MLSRNQAKAEEVIKDIKQISGNDLIQFCQLDLASFKSGTYLNFLIQGGLQGTLQNGR